MGKIIRALFEVVIPGQDFIYLPHLKGLIYFAKTRKPFIPSPVRKIEDKYVMLDGHTRAIYRKMS